MAEKQECDSYCIEPRWMGLSEARIQRHGELFHGIGGTSDEAASEGFRPAFLDRHTGTVYPSRFQDGRPAPMHFLDGLPAHLVSKRNSDGRVIEASEQVIDGFIRGGRFYTREQAAYVAKSL